MRIAGFVAIVLLGIFAVTAAIRSGQPAPNPPASTAGPSAQATQPAFDPVKAYNIDPSEHADRWASLEASGVCYGIRLRGNLPKMEVCSSWSAYSPKADLLKVAYSWAVVEWPDSWATDPTAAIVLIRKVEGIERRVATYSPQLGYLPE